MALNIGIVGLPNVGKSTIFSALTSAPAEAANYPFCTIDPNIGIVDVPDKRLTKITEIIKPKKEVHNIIEFVDIAGLVKGASKGEGLGNKFLANIREVGAVIHVVRCFENDDIVHVEGSIDPIRDIETIDLELAYADLETVNKRLDKLGKLVRSNDMKQRQLGKQLEPILQELQTTLDEGKPARSLDLSKEQALAIRDMHLLTMKKMIYCCNVDEDAVVKGNKWVEQVTALAESQGAEVVTICGKLECEISELETAEERAEFLAEVGLEESGLHKLIRAGYHLLDLQTFFTAGEQETRAWTFRKGYTAPECAGVIHTDFQRGFIKAEVYHCTDLFDLVTEQAIKDAGKLRIEGKEYSVKDGDVMLFRFNV